MNGVMWLRSEHRHAPKISSRKKPSFSPFLTSLLCFLNFAPSSFSQFVFSLCTLKETGDTVL